MPVAEVPNRLLEEFADLLATNPKREQLLAFEPSAETVERARHLLERSNTGELSQDEEHELEMLQQAELMLRVVKARLRRADTE